MKKTGLEVSFDELLLIGSYRHRGWHPKAGDRLKIRIALQLSNDARS